eukprot:TRINITY_DN4546_c0_g1_i1.p1 TRINITY_DN4546_c0_g1~~TRINITY_DN4546_c0_g1_i1.p1  ORF type:complete len:832 (+),score=163.02 TRINITY_DN4546_c0_g1_i1:186-2681(+)
MLAGLFVFATAVGLSATEADASQSLGPESQRARSVADPWRDGWRVAGYSSLDFDVSVRLGNGNILTCGYYNPDFRCELFDPTTETFSRAASMNRGRYNSEMVRLDDGRVLAFLGYTDHISVLTSEVYDPVANSWTVLAGQLSGWVGKPAPYAMLADGRILLTGPEDSVQVFDPTTNLWSNVAKLPRKIFRHAVVGLDDGKAMVCGGTIEGSVNTTDACTVWDPSADAWTSSAPMPSARSEFVMTQLNDGNVLAIYGFKKTDRGWAFVNQPHVYDPTADRWSVVQSATTVARLAPARAWVDTNRLMFVGGLDGHLTSLSNCEIFDNAARTVTPCAPLGKGRSGGSLFQLRDGVMLAMGGDVSVAVLGKAAPATAASTCVLTGKCVEHALAVNLQEEGFPAKAVSTQTGFVSAVKVEITLVHYFLKDVIVELVSPQKTVVMLVNRTGGKDHMLVHTELCDSANSSLARGQAPFTGTFRPVAALSSLRGLEAAGTWTVRMRKGSREVGDLIKVQLTLCTTPTDPSGCLLSGSCVAKAAGGLPLLVKPQKNNDVTLPIFQLGAVKSMTVEITIRLSGKHNVVIRLISPQGVSVVLFDHRLSGVGLIGTRFCDSSIRALSNSAEPYTGTFKPLSPMSRFKGVAALGAWTIRVMDTSTGGSAKITGATLTVCSNKPGFVNYTTFNNRDYRGFDLSSIGNTRNVEDCQLACARRTDCNAFAFAAAQSRCFLKNVRATAPLSVSNGRVAGYKCLNGTCPARCKVQPNSDYRGFDIDVMSNVPNVDACCRACSEHRGPARCNAFSYNRASKRCYKKRLVGTVKPTYHAQAVTGRVCNNDC